MRAIKTLGVALVAVSALVAPSRSQDSEGQSSGPPHEFHLPASYVGNLPCADCPGIRMILTMAPDSVYLLRRVYREAKDGEDRTVTVHGRWRVSPDGRVLHLFKGNEREASFTILEHTALRLRDASGEEIVADQNYELARAGGIDPIPDVLDLTGYFSHSHAGDIYTDCLAGRSIPVANEGARDQLVKSYEAMRRTSGEALLVSLSGKLEWREKASGRGSERVLVVERVKRFWQGYQCGDELPIFKLESGIWELFELNGDLVNVSGRVQRPSVEFRPGEDKAVGFGACNRFTASYETDGEGLKFGPAAATRMACEEGATLEASFFNMLGRVTRYEVKGPMLHLYAENELVAKLRLRG